MKSFKEYVTMNEAGINEIVDYNTMKLPRLRKILGDPQMKKANASTQNKKLQFQNQIGIIKSVIADKEKQEMNEKASVKKGSDLKVGDVILYGREDTPHEVTSKPKQDGPGYWVEVLNLSNKKKDRIYVDSGDTVTMNEAEVNEALPKGFIAYNTMIVLGQALRKGAGALDKHVEKSVIRRFELDNSVSVSKLQGIEIEGYNFGLRDIEVAIKYAVFNLDSGETETIKNITYQIPMI